MKVKHQIIVSKYNIKFLIRNSPYLVNSNEFFVSDRLIYAVYYSYQEGKALICASNEGKLGSTVIYEKHYCGKLNIPITELLIISLIECFKDKL